MECVMIDQSGNGMEQPAAVFSKTIDGKPFIVRTFSRQQTLKPCSRR